ncbi:hypothetical protein PHMEG_00017142 [Phytophthora megakarya]|uniref:Uncharacterized protein n=1 Tax=Phytophthora megakarya TaxID=4795 RepID=A0A225VXH8_9STRA|nr:hypothetical protein PHMEG_00017142 [Phytophthora megakarya]
MSMKAVIPRNSRRTRQTALNAFERFAEDEKMTVKELCELIGKDPSGDTLYIVLDKLAMYLAFRESSKATLEMSRITVKELCELIGKDPSGDTLYIVLDKLAMHLAFRESSKGSLLSKNSVSSYFGNVKNHLLEMFPTLHAASGCRRQKFVSVLDKYCSKRADFTHLADPCTKRYLRALCTTILTYATTAEDYKDYALLNFLWYLLSRSSGIIGLMKNQTAVYPAELNLIFIHHVYHAGGCLFITFKRMKSAATHGSSLF